MARPNFFNENRGRTFPFLQHRQEELEVSETTTLIEENVLSISQLPNSAIVDFGATMGTQAFFQEATHDVYLYEVRRLSNAFEFEFRSTAPGLSDRPLVFTRSLTSDDYETEYIDTATEPEISESGSLSVSSCVEDSIWQAYLVTGTMSDLAEVLDSTGMSLRGEADEMVVEPALIQNLLEQYVRSLNLANAERSRSEAPPGCQEFEWPFALDTMYVNYECMTGIIKLKEGFNVSIDQDDVDNALTINASVGAGEGEPCEEVPLFEGEAPPEGETLLSGGLGCSDVIRSINGIGGRVLEITAGRGAIITSEPSRHRIIIDIDMSSLKICYDGDDPPESSDVETSTSYCGPA